MQWCPKFPCADNYPRFGNNSKQKKWFTQVYPVSWILVNYKSMGNLPEATDENPPSPIKNFNFSYMCLQGGGG